MRIIKLMSSAAVCVAVLGWIMKPGWGYTVEDKMKLEQWYASQATSVSENYVGKGSVVTFVHVYLDTMQSQKAKDVYSLDGGKQGEPGTSLLWHEEGKSPQQFILPGFPVESGNLNGGGPVSGKYEHTSEQQTELPQTVITKMDVQMFVDNQVKDERLRELPGIVASTLSMDKGRGDTITIRKIPFPPPPPPLTLMEQFLKLEVLLDAAKFTVHTFLVLLGVFLFYGILRALARDFTQMVHSRKVNIREELRHDVLQDRLGAGSEGGDSAKDGLPQGNEDRLPDKSAANKKDEGRHFGFVNAQNMERLAWLIRNEDADKIAITISYLEPLESHLILSALTPDKRDAVLKLLTKTFDIEPEKVIEWENIVKKKIDYVLAGPEMLVGMLDNVDEASREKLLQEISTTNMKLAEDLRESMFLFESIGYLDEKDIRQLLRKVPNDLLVIALQGMPSHLVDKILATRTEEGRNMLKEAIELSQKFPEKQVFEARQTVVKLARSLIKDGIIIHKKPKRVDAYVV